MTLYPIQFDAASENSLYESVVRGLIKRLCDVTGCFCVVFGDLHLSDILHYREELLLSQGCRGLFALWGEDTAGLARGLCSAESNVLIVCGNAGVLGREIVGKPLDLPLLESLPPQVDPCGEGGEFHTFVSYAPGFRAPVPVSVPG